MPDVGDNLGRYTLLRRLAVGGMGEVFVAAKAGPVGFGPYVALKVLREELAVDRQFVEMLVDEANISMFLNHQNVVSVLDLSEDDGRYYIAMEYVQGVTVERLVESLAQRNLLIPIPHALYIATELCRALKYAHTRVNHAGEPLNIIHRDVTPANILLSTQGEVKLTDFGIARARGRVHQTQAGVLKGKFGYMAPEMVRYERIDGRADLFCAGVVVYLMIAGKHPVAGAAVMEAIQRFEDKQVPPPSQLNPAIPPALDTIVMRALEPKPELRWASAAALGDALQDVVLQNPAWRRDAKDGPKNIAQLMRQVAGEAFDEPVPRDKLAGLLAKAQRATGTSTYGSELSTAASKAASGPWPERPASGEITARRRVDVAGADASIADTADQLDAVHAGAGSSQNLVELPTHEALPAISEDDPWGPTPAVAGAVEIETDEELSLARVHSALEPAEAPRLDTGDLSPVPNTDATIGYDAVVRTDSSGVKFPESSTDRNRVRDEMMAEPSLPAGAEERRGDADEDGATVVGVAIDEIEPDDDDELIGEPTMAMPAVDSGRDDSKTVSGMEMPDWDAMASNANAAPVAFDPTVVDDEDAATIIPRGPGGASIDPEVAAMLDPDEWGVNETTEAGDVGDATLLDGVQAAEVHAALRDQRGGAASIVRDESGSADFADGEEDAIFGDKTAAMDPVDSGPSPVVGSAPSGPQPFDGPIRIVMTDDKPHLAKEDSVAALARNAASAHEIGMDSGELPTINPSASRPTAEPPLVSPVHSSGANDVGAATGRWMAGELDANALEWSDDAAARRAVATRNAHHSPPAGTPSASYPGYPPSTSSPPPHGATPSRPVAQMPYPPHVARSSFLARNGLMLLVIALFVSVLVGLGATWSFTAVFWPKLKLDSVPAGAAVSVDEQPRGTTPLEVKVAPGQRHLIEFTLPGHKRALREITEGIGRGRTYTLTVTMDRVAPRVSVPVDARVFVNGREVGAGTTIDLNGLPDAGEVRVRVVAEGYEPYELTFASPQEVPDALDIPLAKKN